MCMFIIHVLTMQTVVIQNGYDRAGIHVVHGILKEHKVHHGIDLIVGLQGLLQDPTEGLPGGHRQVLGLPNP